LRIKQLFNSRQIKTAALGSLGIKFFSALFAFLSSILLARILGVEQFGIYILAFTTSILLSVPVSLGLPTLITRYISKYEVTKDNAAIKGLLIRSNQIVVATTALILLVAGLSYLLWWKNLDPMLVKTIWMSFLLLPLIALGSLRAAALRGLRYIILGQLPDTLLRNFLLCLGIGIYYLLGFELSPVIAMGIHAIAAATAYIVGYIFLRKKLLSRLRVIVPKYHNKEWMKQAIPFSLNSGVQVIKSRLLTYILAIFGSLESVAIFDVALRAAALVAFTLDALNTAIAPYISKAFENDDLIKLQRIVKKTSQIIFLFAIPVVLVFIFGGKPLLVFLFGSQYIASYIPLVLLCIGQLVNAATGSVGLVLNMTGRQAYYTKVTIFVTVINLILSIPLVILYDVIGAASIHAGLLIVQNIILVWFVKREMKINTTIL